MSLWLKSVAMEATGVKQWIFFFYWEWRKVDLLMVRGAYLLVSVRFFRTKTGSNRFGSVFFSIWVRFGSVRFFRFQVYKTEPNWTGRFFSNFNRFFFTIWFFQLIFFNFFNLIVFFLAHFWFWRRQWYLWQWNKTGKRLTVNGLSR